MAKTYCGTKTVLPVALFLSQIARVRGESI